MIDWSAVLAWSASHWNDLATVLIAGAALLVSIRANVRSARAEMSTWTLSRTASESRGEGPPTSGGWEPGQWVLRNEGPRHASDVQLVVRDWWGDWTTLRIEGQVGGRSEGRLTPDLDLRGWHVRTSRLGPKTPAEPAGDGAVRNYRRRATVLWKDSRRKSHDATISLW
jgi:hypothetical protein